MECRFGNPTPETSVSVCVCVASFRAGKHVHELTTSTGTPKPLSKIMLLTSVCSTCLLRSPPNLPNQALEIKF
eukprot:115897-Amphidinium_carterae.2